MASTPKTSYDAAAVAAELVGCPEVVDVVQVAREALVDALEDAGFVHVASGPFTTRDTVNSVAKFVSDTFQDPAADGLQYVARALLPVFTVGNQLSIGKVFIGVFRLDEDDVENVFAWMTSEHVEQITIAASSGPQKLSVASARRSFAGATSLSSLDGFALTAKRVVSSLVATECR